MHGNVREWVQDWYGLSPTEGTATKPVGPAARHFGIDTPPLKPGWYRRRRNAEEKGAVMNPAWLGIDLGGTGVKVGLFDPAGQPLAAAHRRYSPDTLPDGRVEIPIETIETAAREAVREAVSAAGAPVSALAIVSQGQTFVSLDEADTPLHPAILWYDSRAAAEAEALNRALEAEPPPRPQFLAISSAAKIVWLRARQPDVMARARRHLLLPDYLVYRLTGQAVTDPQTAGTTGLTGDDGRYHPAALAAAGLTERQMAEIRPSGAPAGHVTEAAAPLWGIPAGTPVMTGANDQYAGAMGAGLCRPGLLSVATGTCLALVTLSRRPPPPLPPGLWSGHFPIPGFHFILAYSKTAGVAMEWFQRTLAPTRSMRELDQEAAAVPIGSRGITASPHFDGCVSPTPDAATRGGFAGLALQHGRADLYRALLESLAFSLRESREALDARGYPIDQIRAIGGAAKSDFWLQMQADVTGLPVQRPRVTEAATAGAAMLAAAGAGAFPSLEESVAALYQPETTFSPIADHHAAYEAPFRRYVEWAKMA